VRARADVLDDLIDRYFACSIALHEGLDFARYSFGSTPPRRRRRYRYSRRFLTRERSLVYPCSSIHRSERHCCRVLSQASSILRLSSRSMPTAIPRFMLVQSAVTSGLTCPSPPRLVVGELHFSIKLQRSHSPRVYMRHIHHCLHMHALQYRGMALSSQGLWQFHLRRRRCRCRLRLQPHTGS